MSCTNPLNAQALSQLRASPSKKPADNLETHAAEYILDEETPNPSWPYTMFNKAAKFIRDYFTKKQEA